MFTNKVKESPHSQKLIEEEFERTLAVMKTTLHESKEYAAMLNAAQRLHEMMNTKEETSSSVSRETLVTVGANLLGILMIIRHEFAHPLTSKALSFVIRPRV